MFIFIQSITCDFLLTLLFILFVNIRITTATTILSLINDDNNRLKRADEYVMTSSTTDGIKRSNVCGDGYRIEGALIKSYPFTKSQTYLPYEDCYMTFKARRPDTKIRIRFLSLDMNDIVAGAICLDTIRFYKSVYITQKDRLDIVECGQVMENQKMNVISPTGIVTAHFSTDGGNVSGLGFKAVLTAFRYPNKTHPCDTSNDEYLCNSQECISSLLKCDGVQHCLDGSDELPCVSSNAESLNTGNTDSNNRLTSKRQHWRGVLIAAFLLIILAVFVLFMVYFIFRRFINPSVPLNNGERKNYASIFNFPKNRLTTKVVIPNNKSNKRLDADYNLI